MAGLLESCRSRRIACGLPMVAGIAFAACGGTCIVSGSTNSMPASVFASAGVDVNAGNVAVSTEGHGANSGTLSCVSTAIRLDPDKEVAFVIYVR